jgi:hypothetical protein
MPEYMQILRQLFTDADAVSIDFERISSFHKFVVDQLPYGQIDQNALVQGLVEFDGPEQEPENSKTPLQWHFGGIPYEVCKAIRIEYAYQKDIDGLRYNSTGSLFIGYESTLALVQKYAQAREGAFAARQAAQAYPRDIEDFIRAARHDYVVSPTRVTPQAIYVTTALFDAFVEMNFPWKTPEQGKAIWEAAERAAAANSGQAPLPTPLARMLDPGPSGGLPGACIEYDGPARDYNSKKAFPYTTQTLFNDPSGLYGKVLWWYFGGAAYRITKAMRLTYEDPESQGRVGLLVGYQGPSIP